MARLVFFLLLLLSVVLAAPVQAQGDNPQTRPDGTLVHIVQPGETLWRIASLYNVSVDDLRAWNNLAGSSTIFAGQNLIVGQAQVTATPTNAPMTSTPPPTLTPLPGLVTLVPSSTPQPQVEVNIDAEDAADATDAGEATVSENSDESDTMRGLVRILAVVILGGAVLLTGGLVIFLFYRVFRTG